MRERGGVVLREAVSERGTQLRQRVRTLPQPLPGEGDDGIEVDPAQERREVAVAPDEPVIDRLDEPAQRQRVSRDDEVDRPAHDAEPRRAAFQQRRFELRRLEPGDARPERDVGVARHLRLQPDEVPDDLERRPFDPLEQELARERRPVQRPVGEGLAQRPVVEKCW